MLKPELNEDEQAELFELIRREREEEKARADIIKKYSNRAAIVKNVSVILFPILSAIGAVFLYVSGIADLCKENAKDNRTTAHDLSKAKEEIDKLRELVTNLRIKTGLMPATP